MRRFLRRWLAHAQGVALVEFALVLPLLLMLFFGGFELARYILITQRVEKAGYTLADILTQTTPEAIKDPANFVAVFNQYSTIMTPYSDVTMQRIIFTSVTKHAADHNIYIDWQEAGGGTLDNADTVSIVNHKQGGDIVNGMAAPNTPAPFNAGINDLLMPGTSQLADPRAMADGENMIVTEVFFFYQPLVNRILGSIGIDIGPGTIVRRTYFHPRNGDLNQLT
ncbi:MAG: TadE/TadG family type IV pilus assembly protein [Alphaproteobacteria bacterium]